MLRNLVRAARGGEAQVQQFIAEYLVQLGANLETFDYLPRELKVSHELPTPETVDPGERTVVVGRVPGSREARSILLFAHPDSEPIAGTETWTYDPFHGSVEGDRLYGWGVGDDLVGVATGLAAMDAVREAGPPHLGEVVFASTPSKRRAQGIIATLDRGYRADAALYLHPAESGEGLDDIKSVTSGTLRFKIDIEGSLPNTHEPVHTPFVHQVADPLAKALVIYGALQALADERADAASYPPLEARVGRATNLHVAHLRYGNEAQLGRVSPECTMAVAVTFPPHEDVREVQKQIAAAIDEAAKQDEWLKDHPPRVSWLLGVNGAEVRPEHPLFQLTSHAVEQVTGHAPTVNPLHTASDIRNPIHHSGIPTIGLGSLVGNLTQAGHVNEWADIPDFIRAVKVTALIIAEWCASQPQDPRATFAQPEPAEEVKTTG